MDPSPSIPRDSVSGRLLPIERWALALVLGMAVLHGMVAGMAPLSTDEAYYWEWTRPLELSYYDHPAMVAYWIWAGIHLLGETALGVRLLGLGSALAVSVLVWDGARIAFHSRAAGALAALWLNSTVLFSSASIVMTPDAPLMLFWALALWAVLRVIDNGGPVYFYIAGLALGLGADSKYTIVLLAPAIAATFLLFPSLRRALRGRHPWLALALAAACTTPVVLWNLLNGFASFHKQFDHAFGNGGGDNGIGDPLWNLLGYFAGEFGLVTPLIFLFCLWGMAWALWAGWRERRPKWFLLGLSSLPVFVFFAAHALEAAVQPHWPGPAYIGGVMAAAGASLRLDLRARLSWAFWGAPLLGLAMTLLVMFQAATALLPVPPKLDALKRLGGWDELAAAVQQERQAHPGVFLLAEKPLPAGPVSFYLPDHPPVFFEGPIRPSFYTAADVAALKGRDAIFFTGAVTGGGETLDPKSAYVAQHFAKMILLRQVILHWGGRPADVYNVYMAEDYRGGLLAMGDGFPASRDAP